MGDRIIWIGTQAVPSIRETDSATNWSVEVFSSIGTYLAGASERDLIAVFAAETASWAEDVALLSRELWNRRLAAGVVIAIGRPTVEELEQAWRLRPVEVIRLPCSAVCLRHLLLDAARRWKPIGQAIRELSSYADREKSLSPRQWQMCQYLVFGHSIKRVAARCQISAHTARHQRSRLLEKLGLQSEVELAFYWSRMRLLEHFEWFLRKNHD